jgi:hypothetical protein
MDGAAVIAAYHELWQVEASFRMTKSDLRARPVFHHEREAIEAHLTVVFAALAISRDLQSRTGVTIKKLIQTLRTARSATIEINGQHITLEPKINWRAPSSTDSNKVTKPSVRSHALTFAAGERLSSSVRSASHCCSFAAGIWRPRRLRPCRGRRRRSRRR